MDKLYIRDNYLKKIRGFYADTEIIKVLTGVRRCGKSSIMRMIMNELIDTGIPRENIIFLPLDLRPYKVVSKVEQLEQLIDDKAKGIFGVKYLFIDEIQKVKGFETTLNAYREEGFSIFITGSNGYLLSGQLSTYLTGRYIEFEIHTLSFNEYIGMKNFFGKTVDPDLDIEFYNYVMEGGFPLAVKYDSLADKRIYVKSIITEIYEKDINRNKKIRKKQLFEQVKQYVINNFGAPMSVYNLCNILSDGKDYDVQKETVYNYISILENAKIISRCPRFDIKSKRSLNGSEKYYLSDLSFYFVQNVDNRINYGPVLENIVYNYARSQRYEVSVGKIGSLEIDFIMRNVDMDYSYVQIAQTIQNNNLDSTGNNITEEREYRPLEKIADGYPKYLFTLDKLLQKRSGIKHLNLIRALLSEIQF